MLKKKRYNEVYKPVNFLFEVFCFVLLRKNFPFPNIMGNIFSYIVFLYIFIWIKKVNKL